MPLRDVVKIGDIPKHRAQRLCFRIKTDMLFIEIEQRNALDGQIKPLILKMFVFMAARLRCAIPTDDAVQKVLFH